MPRVNTFEARRQARLTAEHKRVQRGRGQLARPLAEQEGRVVFNWKAARAKRVAARLRRLERTPGGHE